MTTLRYYDEIGLLKPIHVDLETGYRFYTMDQLPHLHRILAFKELGLGLHHGHLSLVLSAYQALGTWMENNAYTIVGPRRKIRLRREENLDDALTEIQFPVEKVA